MKNENGVILIADDDYDMRKLVGDYLCMEGYDVVEACNGREVFPIALAENPDVILLDVMMPFKNGLEVCRELKSDERTRDASIVMFTVKGKLSDKLTAYVAGAQRYLGKPCELNEITDCLQTVFSQRNVKNLQYERET